MASLQTKQDVFRITNVGGHTDVQMEQIATSAWVNQDWLERREREETPIDDLYFLPVLGRFTSRVYLKSE